MAKLPKKNISKFLSDIRIAAKPKISQKITPTAHSPELMRRLAAFIRKNKRIWRPVGIVIIFVLFIYGGMLTAAKIAITKNVDAILEQAAPLKKAIPEFKTETIVQSLGKTNAAIQLIHSQAKISGLLTAVSALSRIFSPLEYIPESLNNAALLSENVFRMGKDIDYLKRNGFQLMTQEKGGELINLLERLEKNVGQIIRLNAEIKNTAFHLKAVSPELASLSRLLEKNYLPVNLQLYRAQSFLQSLLAILKQPGDQHLLLIFQNPSEMRPAGGFIGSFGIITLNQGNISRIAIDDIYNADRQLNALLIPPKELQGITKNWGARDANWFFDFPTSAQKVIELLEQSNLHSQNFIRFHGAIAINTNILKTLLEITGPIELPAYQLTIDHANFLKEIQYEVEAGRDKKPGQNPKRILSVFLPLLLEKLDSLNEEQKNQLINGFKNHFDKKNIQIYFKDWKLQNFVESIGAAGEVSRLSKDFSGDYLAVVNANVGGGKTDAVINQAINLHSTLDTDGATTNTLTITRRHNGLNETDWWYRSINKNYLKILVPETTRLLSIQGNHSLSIIKTYNYDKEKYAADPELQEIEKNSKLLADFQVWAGKEFEKKSFGTWTILEPDKEEFVRFVYQREKALEIKDGTRYEFLLEKQSGNTAALSYSITAPPGYFWKESGSETFTYEKPEPDSREHLKITLRKL